MQIPNGVEKRSLSYVELIEITFYNKLHFIFPLLFQKHDYLRLCIVGQGNKLETF